MNLKITSIADIGVPGQERLVLKVLANTDVGRFVVFRTLERKGTVTTGVRNTFWFPDKAVAAGDLVVLYTKAGSPSEKKLNSGETAHFFYWGIGEPIWQEKGMAAVLLHAGEWKSFVPHESD